MRHFYYKYLKDNWGLETNLNLLKLEDIDKLKGKEIILSIYFGHWKADEVNKGIEMQQYMISKNQIEHFYSLENSLDDDYFWIFHKENILMIKIIKSKIFDGPEDLYNPDPKFKTPPKSIKGEVIKVLKKIELPEVFSNINSNQKYNRRTLQELENTEKVIADSIVNNNKINITNDNFLDYLSPTEFETLIFLIFSNEKVTCSSYRGGTLKDYDLRIKVKENIKFFNTGEHWIQVKYKSEYKRKNENETFYTIYNGLNNVDDKLLGREWLLENIKGNKIILNWLKEMTFDYPDVYSINI